MAAVRILIAAVAIGIAQLCGLNVLDWVWSSCTISYTVVGTLFSTVWRLLQPGTETTYVHLPELHQAILNVTHDAARVADLLEDFIDQYREDPALKDKFMAFMAAQANTSYSVVDNKLSWVLWLYSLIWMPLLVVLCLTRAAGGGGSSSKRAAAYGTDTAASGLKQSGSSDRLQQRRSTSASSMAAAAAGDEAAPAATAAATAAAAAGLQPRPSVGFGDAGGGRAAPRSLAEALGGPLGPGGSERAVQRSGPGGSTSRSHRAGLREPLLVGANSLPPVLAGSMSERGALGPMKRSSGLGSSRSTISAGGGGSSSFPGLLGSRGSAPDVWGRPDQAVGGLAGVGSNGSERAASMRSGRSLKVRTGSSEQQQVFSQHMMG